MCDVKREAYFSKKRIFQNGQNMSLLQWAWDEKTVNGVKTHWLSS